MPKNITPDEAIEILEFKDKELGRNYDYKKFVYKDSKTKSTVICPEHGKFQASFATLTHGIGCPKCGLLKRAESRRLTQNEAIEIFKAEDKEFERIYDYSKFKYINSNTKSIVICPEHGEFQASFNKLTQGKGCPKCGGNYHYTPKEAIEILKSKDKEIGRKYDYSNIDIFSRMYPSLEEIQEYVQFL
jgi:hypothetical protein